MTKPTDKMHRIRVEVTHELSTEALQGLWAYWKDEPFKLREAIALARELLSNNPEIEVQIHEGLNRLHVECPRCGSQTCRGECESNGVVQEP